MKKKKPTAKKAPVQKSNTTTSSNTSGIMPLGDRVVIKPLSAEEMHRTTSFGIIIPDTAKEKPEQGVVVAVGPGKRNEHGDVHPVGVRAGDKVMFSKYGYDEVKVNGVEYYIVNESNLLAVLN